MPTRTPGARYKSFSTKILHTNGAYIYTNILRARLRVEPAPVLPAPLRLRQIDAFVQRCSELLEVCESQIQLARKTMGEGGKSGALPEFGGTRGQEVWGNKHIPWYIYSPDRSPISAGMI